MAFLHHQPQLCLGVDIAKDTITASDGTATRTIANQRRAIRELLKSYQHIDLVVCEPTGGHETLLLEQCLRVGIACHRADTLKVKSFIRSFGTKGKSDAIDAGMLGGYGRERWAELSLWQPLDVWSQPLMVHHFRPNQRMHYGPGSTRQRHHDRGDPSSNTE
ncbi:hypothetical protein EOD23_29360 [Mesorhizobium sp. USDA-HM6]|nr:hypothetical protein EOD23_29360 [Mesorhizobium sp. USDA-HM6]